MGKGITFGWIVPFIPILMGVILISTDFRKEPEKKWAFFNAPFEPEKINRLEGRFVQFQDTIPNDTLYVCLSSQDLPLAFCREIRSGVCLDGTCRPVYLYLYWTISGNYLGFTLDEGEILTKNEHEMFEARDYSKLHALLNDPQSLLANYSLEEITPEDPVDPMVDGVSGATLSDIRGYIIDGAAYTTHTLWHIVYGPTRDSLLRLSSDYSSELLVDRMLTSTNRQDQKWAILQFQQKAVEFQTLIPKIQQIILTSEYVIKELAIQSLLFSALDGEIAQLRLLDTFPEADLATKRMSIHKLSDHGMLSEKAVDKVISQITEENNIIVNMLFSLLKEAAVPEPLLLRKVLPLLNHEKKNISQAAYVYLTSAGTVEPALEKALESYRNKIRGN